MTVWQSWDDPVWFTGSYDSLTVVKWPCVVCRMLWQFDSREMTLCGLQDVMTVWQSWNDPVWFTGSYDSLTVVRWPCVVYRMLWQSWNDPVWFTGCYDSLTVVKWPCVVYRMSWQFNSREMTLCRGLDVKCQLLTNASRSLVHLS